MKVDPGQALRLIDQEERFGSHEPYPLDLVFGRGEGIHLWDVQGNRFMDFLTGSAGLDQGHVHTRVAAAMVEQGLRLTCTSRSLRHDRLPPLLEKLCTFAGFGAAGLFCTAGEATRAALSAASRARRTRDAGPEGASVLAFTGSPWRGAAQPLPRWAPYGDLEAAKAALGRDLCAILVEPVQARNVCVPPRGFLRGLRDLCDGEGLLLLADETAAGMGRTGKRFAFEHEGVRPDGVILGEALGGGFLPASAFLASRELLALADPHLPVSPFGGHPLACAVVSSALDVLVEERLADRSAELGAYFVARLQALESPRIRRIRGLGLWAALDLDGPSRPVREHLAHEGLLCQGDGECSLTFAPPLSVTREQLDWALEKVGRVLGR